MNNTSVHEYVSLTTRCVSLSIDGYRFYCCATVLYTRSELVVRFLFWGFIKSSADCKCSVVRVNSKHILFNQTDY